MDTETKSKTKIGTNSLLVSIITPVYNSEATIAKTIESVLNQTYQQIEYIIMDGASTDKTIRIAESYKQAFKNAGINYYIISEKDNGMYDALNQGIRKSKGKIIGNINADDWYETDAIENVVQFYRKTQFDFMYGDIRVYKKNGQTYVKHSKKSKFMSSRYWNHPTQFAVRKVYEKEPYRVESLHDDFDLLLRVTKKNYDIEILNKVLANFSMGGISHEQGIKNYWKRCLIRYSIYRKNKYSRWYFLECIFMEFGKFIFDVLA